MSHSLPPPFFSGTLAGMLHRRALIFWLGAVPTLAGSVAIGLSLFLLPMTSREVWTLAFYVGGTSLLGIAAGWGVLGVFDRVFHPSLAIVALAATLVGAAVALANVWIVSSLMFVNTAHDLRLLVVLLLSSTVVTFTFSASAAARTARRLRSIGDAIGRLSALDYSDPAPVDGRGEVEVARLMEDVEALRVRLAEVGAEREALDNDRRYLTAAISHDLRTPLAIVHALVDALEDGVVDGPDETGEYYRRIRRETERLTRMVDDLRELAAIDAGALALDGARLQLQDVVVEVIESLLPLSSRAGVELTLRLEGAPPALNIDPQRMERAVANLIRNALEHSPEGAVVIVEVSPESGGVALRVHDQGLGLAEADRERIWDRFYRGEASRRRSSLGGDGAGLGLAIVRGIVEAHGGRTSAAPRPEGGATFEIWLPTPS